MAVKRCKKCKYYLNEGDIEYWVVHQWESHGASIEVLREGLELLGKELNDDLIKEIIQNHKQTGKASLDRFKEKI